MLGWTSTARLTRLEGSYCLNDLNDLTTDYSLAKQFTQRGPESKQQPAGEAPGPAEEEPTIQVLPHPKAPKQPFQRSRFQRFAVDPADLPRAPGDPIDMVLRRRGEEPRPKRTHAPAAR